MKFKTMTEREALLRLLPERIEEHNLMHRDAREHLSLLSSDDGSFRLRVRRAVSEDAAVDLTAAITSDRDGSTCLDCALVPLSSGKRRFGAVLYGLLLAGFARLTLLALLYGAILGISLLAGGDGPWLPLIPPVALALFMALRAIRVSLGMRRRITAFFTSYLGCTGTEAE